MGSIIRRIVLFLLVLASLLLITRLAWAGQNAVVYGTVYDVNGKPMSGITVLLENPPLSLARVTISSADGSYTIAEIPPAEGYRITALRSGKKVDLREGVVVNVGDERVIVPPLREQAPVTAVAEPVARRIEPGVSNERISASISGVITAEQLRTLPLYNRNFLALGLLTPNTHDVEGGSALAGATFSIAGARPVSNNFLLDGSDNVASGSNQAIPFQVNDSIQEFRVISALANAEYGRNLGGVVNVVTRRATSGFHGGLFGYFGNDALNANEHLSVYRGSGFDLAASDAGPKTLTDFTYAPTTYNDYAQLADLIGYCTDSLSPTHTAGTHFCPMTGGYGKNTLFDPAALLATNDSRFRPFDSKQFGANLGGGVFKNRLFLFGSYEGTRIDNPNPVFERVPSTFDRTYNPLLAMNFPSMGIFQFPSSSADYRLAKNIVSLYPAANVIAVPAALEFYRGQAPNYTNVHNILARADVVQGDKANWTFRYSVQKLDQLHDASLPSTATYPGNGALRDALNQNLTATYTRSLSNRMTNETRIGLARFRVDESPQDASLDATKLGLPNKQLMTFLLSGIDPQYSGASPEYFGAINGWADALWVGAGGFALNPTLDGLFPMARIGAPMSAPGSRTDFTFSLSNSLSWSLGKHAVKMGFEFRRLRNDFLNGAFARGSVVSGNIGEFTSDAETCGTCFSALAADEFYAPSFDYALRQPSPFQGQFLSHVLGGYLQDTWRLHPRLTVTAGLRYEYFSQPLESNHNIWNFDPVANGLIREGTRAVVDVNGQPCKTTRRFNAIYPDQAGTMDWSCQPVGNAAMPRDYNNFAPRIGMAWDLTGSGNTVVRFGAGWFYDQLPLSVAEQLLFNRPTPLSLTNPQAIYGQNFASSFMDERICIQCGFGNTTLDPARIAALKTANYQAAASPFGIIGRDALHALTPNSRQISGTLQQQVGSKMALEIGYIGTFGDLLPVVYNANFNREWFCTACDQMGPAFLMTNRGNSNYHSMMLRVRSAEWHGLRLNATYNFAKSLDNASSSVFPVLPVTMLNQLWGFQLSGVGNPSVLCSFSSGGLCGSSKASATGPRGAGSVVGSDNLAAGLTTTGMGDVFVSRYNIPQDPTNFLVDDYGPSDFDSRHRVIVDFTWQVPSPKRGKLLFGNWLVSGIVNAQSGQPFTIFSGPLFGELTQRATVTGPVQMTGSPDDYILTTFLQPAAVSCGDGSIVPTKPLCLGNSRRNAFVGPAFSRTDMAVQKSFPMGEARAVVLRAEFFNLFDRANYYNPISTLSQDGVTRNPDFGQIKSVHSPRQIQLALRFNW